VTETKRIPYVIWGVLIVVLAVCLLVFSVFIRTRAVAVGSNVGEVNGRIVGTAIGSFNGITQGIEEGIDAGTQAGLSAVDTSADVKGTMESIGRLEVLAAGVTLKNINTIGEAYKGLYVISGDAIFTVDLGNAEISFSQDGKDVYIWIPEPTLELFLDQSSTRKLAETQHFSLSVSAQDGLIAYLNSMTQTVDNVKKSLTNYDALMKAAKDSARTQVMLLAKTVCGDSQTVHVEFK